MFGTSAKLLAAGTAAMVLIGGLAMSEPVAAWSRETFYGAALRRDGVPPSDRDQAEAYAVAKEFEETGPDRLGDYPTLNWADERILEGFATDPRRARAMLLHVFPDVLEAGDFNAADGRLRKAGGRKALRAMCDSSSRALPFGVPNGPAILNAVIAQQSGIATSRDNAQDLSCGGLLLADARAAQAAADHCFMSNQAAVSEAAARGDMDTVNNGIVSKC